MPEFLTNIVFWTAVTAVVALFGALRPELMAFFRGVKLVVTPRLTLLLSHQIGNPTCVLFLSVHNRGGRRVTITDATLELRHEDRCVALPAQTYMADFQGNELPVVEYHLDPDQRWASYVFFFESLGREEERRQREMTSKLKADINEKLWTRGESLLDTASRALGSPESQAKLPAILSASQFQRPVEADPEVLAPVMEFFKEKFPFKTGEYAVTLRVTASPAKASIVHSYRMILFDSDIEALRAYSDAYKRGEGVYYNFQETRALRVTLTPTNNQ